MINKYVLFGYSGHSYVVIEILRDNQQTVIGYLTKEEVINNPYNLEYLGYEDNIEDLNSIEKIKYFIAVGDNLIRKKITEKVIETQGFQPSNILSNKSIISSSVLIGNGVLIGSGVVVNALAKIGNGVICNTGSIIEHECIIEEFSHIAPGAVLCGNVKIGKNTLIGAGATIIPGVTVGDNVIIGAGTTITKDVESGSKIIGSKTQKIL